MGTPLLASAFGFRVTMVKVSISLPNNAQITFESDEAEVLREVVSMALRDLPRDLMQAPPHDLGRTDAEPEEKSTSVAGSALSGATATPDPVPGPAVESPAVEPGAAPAPIPAQEPSSPPGGNGASNQETAAPEPEPAPVMTSPAVTPAASPAPLPPKPSNGPGNGQGAAMAPEFLSEGGRVNFVAFCQESNPMGDMRRVVVAIEGARRHFGIDGVDANDLGWLFDMAGWRRPGDFTQTLRNAARSKFGWLERIPGRSGRYAATPLGLSKTLSSS